MESFNFKKNIKSKLEEHHLSNIPEELIWDNISPNLLAGLEKEKKRRKILFWWWIGIGTFLLLGSIFATYSQLFVPSLHKQQQVDHFPIPFENEMEDICPPVTLAYLAQFIKTPNDNIYTNKQVRVASPISPQKQAKVTETLSSKIVLTAPTPTVSTLQEETTSNMLSESFDFIPNLSLNLKPKQPKLYVLPPAEAQIKPIPSKWSVMLYGGLNGFSSNYSFANGENPLLEAEETLVSWSAGIRMQNQFHERWYYQVGLELDQLSTKFEEQLSENIQFYAPGTITKVEINILNGDSTFTTTDTIPGIRTTYIKNYNTINRWSLPVVAGYQFQKSKLEIGLQAGLSFDLLQNEKGFTTFSDAGVIDLSQGAVYNTSLMMSFLMESQLNYRLNNKWSLMMNVGLQQSLSNWINERDEWPEQRPTIYRARLGIIRAF